MRQSLHIQSMPTISGWPPEMAVTPYRSTPVFTEETLPAALQKRHNTKAGVWGVIRVIEGELDLTFCDPHSETALRPGTPGILQPEQWHFVTLRGPMKMQIDFYDQPPPGA